MRVIVTKNYDEMSKVAARMIVSQVILKPNSILGLATGSTPIGTYKEIIKSFELGIVDFKEVISFNLDEYLNIEKENSQSYDYFMKENLFNHININKKNTYIPDGMSLDILNECRLYDKKIFEAGGLDIQLLGIGRNGHIGFNEPDIQFEARTHVVELDQQTIKDNARFFDSVDQVPTKAISMGIKTIMHSKKIILLASGKEKADAVFEAVHGLIRPKLPASVLQLHPDVVFIVDEEAGLRLDLKEIY